MKTTLLFATFCIVLAGCADSHFERLHSGDDSPTTIQSSTGPSQSFFFTGQSFVFANVPPSYVVAVADSNVNCNIPGRSGPPRGGVVDVMSLTTHVADTSPPAPPGVYQLGTTASAQEPNATTTAVAYRLTFDDYCGVTWDAATQATLNIANPNYDVGSLSVTVGNETRLENFQAAPMPDLRVFGQSEWPSLWSPLSNNLPLATATPSLIPGAVAHLSVEEYPNPGIMLQSYLFVSTPEWQCDPGAGLQATKHGGTTFKAVAGGQMGIASPENNLFSEAGYYVYDDACNVVASASATGGVLSVAHIDSGSITGSLYLEFGPTKLVMPIDGSSFTYW